jgi:type I restriction enzyme M protein
MLNVDTRRKIDSCRDILVGKLPDPKAQIEQITYALIYKFMADMDTASVALGGKAGFFVNGYEQYTWDKLMSTNLGGKQRLDLYSEAIAKLSLNPHLPQLFRDIFKDAFLPYRDPETLNMFLKEISWFTYAHSEDLGDAFEYLLSVMSSQGDAGQFRTPRHIIDFIVAVVDPKKDETILDPACGTAGFLISAYKHILGQNTAEKPGDKLTPDEKQDLMNHIVGYDISPDMVRLSLVNMYLHGFPEPHIYEYDTLTDEDRWDDSFDVIMANPPFMSPKGGIRPHKRFSIQANRSEVLFVDYIAEHLNPDGRAGVIVPEGIIFQSGNAYKSLRKMLVDNYLYCVVSLPAGVFNPYSGVKTSILFMDKTLAKQTDKVLFVKIGNDGFDLGAQRREIAGSDFPQALINVKTYLQSVRNGKEFSFTESPDILLVPKQQLAENGDYNFSMDRYKIGDIRPTSWPMVKLGDVCDIYNGSTPKRNEPTYWENGSIPWFTIDDVRNQGRIIKDTIQKITEEGYKNSSVKLLPKNSVLLCCTASVGEYAYTEIELTTNQQFNGIVVNTDYKNKLEPKFIFCLAPTFKKELERLSGKTSFNFVSVGTLKSIKIPLPPLNIQQEIVAEIESYQKIIDGARQVVSNYKPQIKIDPQWPVKNFSDITVQITDGTHITPDYTSSGIPFLRVTDITLSNDSKKFISGKSHQELIKRCHPQKGDVLYTKNGTIGVAKLVDWDWEFSIFVSLALIKPRKDIIDSHYLSCYLNSVGGYEQAVAHSKSGTVTNLHLVEIKAFRIPVPSIDIQQQIVAQIEKEQQLVDANKQLIQIYEQKIKSKIAEVWET